MRWTLLLLPIIVASLTACDDEDARAPTASPEPAPPAERTVTVDVDDPDACAGCHEAVVSEWRSSMHASAHHDADPIYGAMRRLRMGREGEELAGRCAQCHGPRDPGDPSSEVSQVGVGCASCHLVEAVDIADGQPRGARALTWSDGVMRGPHDVDAEAPAPHGVGGAAPWIADGRTICSTCHEAMQNGSGVDTCATGTEYASSGSEQSCAGCHMPEVEGASGAVSTRERHRSHAFLGPHSLYRDPPDPAFMASALAVRATLDGTALRAELRNTTGHSFPTGFPGRMVLVRATGFDAEGEPVWHNFTDDPMSEDPDAVLNKVYVDGEGQPTLPPYGVGIARDTRLEPEETRALSWTVPDGVMRAELTLLYRLIPPPAASALELTDSPLAQPRPFTTVTAAP